MKANEKIEEKLLAYLYGALEKDEAKVIKDNIKNNKTYQDVYNKLIKIKRVIDTAPSSKPSQQFEYVLQKAKIREQEKASKVSLVKLFDLSVLINLIHYIRNRTILKMGLGLVSVLIAAFLLFFHENYNYAYIVKASGDVRINDELFFNKEDFKIKYDLKDNTDVDIIDGECVIQLSQNKLILLKKNTSVAISGKDKINVLLEKGVLIGKVRKNENKKPLLISMKDSSFEIIGTVFLAKQTGGLSKFSVKKGLVKENGKRKEKTVYVKAGESVVIDNKTYTLTKNILTIKEDNDIFKEIENIKIDHKLKNMQKIVLKNDSSQGVVYNKNQKLGKLPLFLWESKVENKRLMVMEKGKISQEIEINNKDKVDYKIKLKEVNSPELLWKLSLGDKVYSKPYNINGYIVISDNNGVIYKIDPESKKILWEFITKKRNDSIPVYYNNTLYISDGNLYAINFNTGKQLWKSEIGTLVYSSPQLYKGNLYTCNSSGFLYCINSDNGKILWNKRIDKGFFSSPLIYKDKLYVGGLSGNFISVNLTTKKISWTFETGNRIISSKSVIYDDIIYFGSNDKHLYALNVNTGKLKWKFLTEGEIFTSPIIVESSIVISTVNGMVYSVNRDEGSQKWVFDTNEKILLKPSYINKKYVYVCTGDNIYILNRWGKLFREFKYSSQGFEVFNDNELLLSGNDTQLYNYNMIID